MNLNKTNRLPLMIITVLFLIAGTQCEMADDKIHVSQDFGKEDLLNTDSTDTGQDSTVVQDSTDVEEDSTETSEQTPSPACSDCDYIVDDSMVIDGKALGIEPGDVIGLDANRTYGRLKFINIEGTPENPVIIKNCDGTAVIYSEDAYGIKFEHSKHFKVLGNGSGATGAYGIRVTTTKGFFMTMEMFTTDFEIAQVEVAGADRYGIGENNGFAGIGVKTSPYQDCDLFSDPTRTAWIMRNVSIHDNYIHDVGGEGIYMGHGMYAGRIESSCSGITYSHSIKGVRVYNNLIEDVGFDGMQIKNADEDVRVYHNIIRNYGNRDHGAHNEGLFIGEGTVGHFYSNIIDTGTGTGCQIQGMGDLYIYNNIFANQQGYGIYAAHGDMVIRKPDAPFNIFNNTIYNSGRMSYVFYNGDGGPKRFINNLVVNAPEFTKSDATTEMLNNVFTNDESAIKFANAANADYHITGGSEAIDTGADLTIYNILDDFEGNPRPSGNGFDIGAFEY